MSPQVKKILFVLAVVAGFIILDKVVGITDRVASKFPQRS